MSRTPRSYEEKLTPINSVVIDMDSSESTQESSDKETEATFWNKGFEWICYPLSSETIKNIIVSSVIIGIVTSGLIYFHLTR